MVLMGLGTILALVFVLPFVSKSVERNLEPFLFVMGVAAAAVSGVMQTSLMKRALEEPILIALAVFVAGIIFKGLQRCVRGWIKAILGVVPFPLFVFAFVTVLGLASSIITVIIASLILVEIIDALEVDRRTKISIDVVACFAIGLGAVLTPIGEPLSTIATSKLGQGFSYLLSLLGTYVVAGVAVVGAFGAFYIGGRNSNSILACARGRMGDKASTQNATAGAISGAGILEAAPAAGAGVDGAAGVGSRGVGRVVGSIEAIGTSRGAEVDSCHETEGYLAVVIRALKVYVFVMALVFLGEGFRPLIERYVIHLGNLPLFWLNMVSAILDNATLTAAEVTRGMSDVQVKSILLGLLISGGMLIPGNIPNIVSAGKLGIGSREWARLGVPLGLVLMTSYFVILALGH